MKQAQEMQAHVQGQQNHALEALTTALNQISQNAAVNVPNVGVDVVNRPGTDRIQGIRGSEQQSGRTEEVQELL